MTLIPRGRRGMLYKVSYCTLVYDKVVVHMYDEIYRTPKCHTTLSYTVYDEIRRTPKCHTTLSYTSKVVYNNFVVHCHTTLLYTLVSHNFVVHVYDKFVVHCHTTLLYTLVSYNFVVHVYDKLCSTLGVRQSCRTP